MLFKTCRDILFSKDNIENLLIQLVSYFAACLESKTIKSSEGEDRRNLADVVPKFIDLKK